MTKAILFWILMLLWLVTPWIWKEERPTLQRAVPGFLLFIVLAILGWAVFGQPVK